MMNLAAFLVTAATCAAAAAPFNPLHQWHYLNFTWPDVETLTVARSTSRYIPENNVLSGVNYYDGYYYLSLPRMREGVPATLVRISEEAKEPSPLLEPYPSWEMNTMTECEAVQNVQNLEIDAEGRMWIIDGGRIATMSAKPTAQCAPKILIHDLKTNTTVLTYVFPPEVADPEVNFLYDLVIDETGDGYAYITDNSRRDPGIIVFSLGEMDSWKIRHDPTMRAQMDAVNLTVDTIAIINPINIAGIALGVKHNNSREVYYTPMSSYHLYSINSTDLQNKTNGLMEFTGRVTDHGVRTSQTDTMIMDDSDNLYYGLINSNSIASWHVGTPFNDSQEVIRHSAGFFHWPKAFTFNERGELVVLTTHLHKFIKRTMHVEDVNFRLLSSHVGTHSYLHDKEPPKIPTTTTTTTTQEPTEPMTILHQTTMDNNVYFHPANGSLAQHSGSPPGHLVTATTTILCVTLGFLYETIF